MKENCMLCFCQEVYVKVIDKNDQGNTIEIIDIECVLGNLAGTQIEKKIALINPPCWICPSSGLCELQWGEFNLPL